MPAQALDHEHHSQLALGRHRIGVRQALAWHQQGLDFADALHLLRSEGCASFAMLDRALHNTASNLALQPSVQLV